MFAKSLVSTLMLQKIWTAEKLVKDLTTREPSQKQNTERRVSNGPLTRSVNLLSRKQKPIYLMI